MTTETVAEMARTNSYVAFFRRLGLTLPDDHEVSTQDRTVALVEAAAWFAFKEQAIFWSLFLKPSKFGLIALYGSSLGIATGVLREFLFPSKIPVQRNWIQWFESDVTLKRSVKLASKATGLTRTILQVGLTILLKRDMLLVNAIRTVMLTHEMGRSVLTLD